VALLLLSLLTACGPASRPPEPAAAPLSVAELPVDQRLFTLLIGRYDSAAQAAANPEFREIHLKICPVSAPSLGAWVLYVEQAAAESLNAPYRQRLYVVEPDPNNPDGAVSRVFELAAPEAAVGLCDAPDRLTFTAEAVEERPGCAVALTWQDGAFVGATHPTACLSTLRGASYATSEVRLTEQGLTSWDRGYDAGGVQVWGAVVGPYEFVRRP
jgi:hypothetical protein